MSIVRTECSSDPYARVSKSLLEDPDLHWKAKGMAAYLLGHGNNWKVLINDLIKKSQDGKRAVYSGLKELKKHGYAEYYQKRLPEGGFGEGDWVIYEHKITVSTKRDSTKRESTKRRTINKKDRSNKRQSGDAAPDSASFFSVNVEFDKFVINASHKLENFLRQKYDLSKRPFNRKRWYDEIRLLLAQIKGDKARLKKAIMGYIKTPHTRYTPKVESAATFRSKFLRIEEWLDDNATKDYGNGRLVRVKMRLPNGKMGWVTDWVDGE